MPGRRKLTEYEKQGKNLPRSAYIFHSPYFVRNSLQNQAETGLGIEIKSETRFEYESSQEDLDTKSANQSEVKLEYESSHIEVRQESHVTESVNQSVSALVPGQSHPPSSGATDDFQDLIDFMKHLLMLNTGQSLVMLKLKIPSFEYEKPAVCPNCGACIKHAKNILRHMREKKTCLKDYVNAQLCKKKSNKDS